MTRTTRRRAPLALAIAAALALAACGDDADDGTAGGEVDPDADVTITVGNMPPTEEAEQRANFEQRLEEFRDENPNITVEVEETEWAADTWNALIAGGTMPTVIRAPFTELQSMIAREQVADITDYVSESEVLSNLNPVVQEVATDGDGRTYGVPQAAWTMGLLYNRDLFQQAGLDPNDPPQTWEDVRAAAQAIEANTDAQGFASLTLENTGGWVLSTMSYSLGSTMENNDGTEATFTGDGTKEALEFYRTLRWEDNSMGSNFLVNYPDSLNLFASGQVGMIVQGADNYVNMVINSGMDPQHYGVAPLPQGADGLGTLGGGTITVINPTATPEQITAAMKWIEHIDFDRFTDQATAVEDAQAANADGVAVGEPVLPVVSAEKYEEWLGWVEESINVPRENFELYLSTVETIPLVPEPPVKAQELYNSLDSVVQAVLTREDADIDQLLNDAQSAFQASLDAG